MCLLHCSGKWSPRNHNQKFKSESATFAKRYPKRSAPGIEPGTSSTQRKNHTSRPSRHYKFWYIVQLTSFINTHLSFYKHSTHLWPLHIEGSHSYIIQLRETCGKNKTPWGYHQVLDNKILWRIFFYAMHSMSGLCEENLTYITLRISMCFFYE